MGVPTVVIHALSVCQRLLEWSKQCRAYYNAQSLASTRQEPASAATGNQGLLFPYEHLSSLIQSAVRAEIA